MVRLLDKKEYPTQLLEIPQPPRKLYIEGNLPEQETKLLCIVGSRKYSSYGKETCKDIINGLRGYDIAIVSGLALGIDAIAHEAALEANLKTIAVPGSGISEAALYPATNRNLAKKIVERGGALLSEFEPNMKATAWSFPQRNRIMAGLSHAVLVIEAEEKSGTLITSKLATEYNRDVLAVPGSIYAPASYGPHMLIKLGARPATGAHDILETFGFEVKNKATASYEDCSDSELEIIQSLSSALSREEIFEKSDRPVHEINSTLSLMELKGLVKEVEGKFVLLS